MQNLTPFKSEERVFLVSETARYRGTIVDVIDNGSGTLSIKLVVNNAKIKGVNNQLSQLNKFTECFATFISDDEGAILITKDSKDVVTTTGVYEAFCDFLGELPDAPKSLPSRRLLVELMNNEGIKAKVVYNKESKKAERSFVGVYLMDAI